MGCLPVVTKACYRPGSARGGSLTHPPWPLPLKWKTVVWCDPPLDTRVPTGAASQRPLLAVGWAHSDRSWASFIHFQLRRMFSVKILWIAKYIMCASSGKKLLNRFHVFWSLLSINNENGLKLKLLLVKICKHFFWIKNTWLNSCMPSCGR